MNAESVPPVAEMMHGLDAMPVEVASESHACVTCGPLTPGVQYYLVNGERTCETCASQVPADESTSLGRFSRAFVYGSIAAMVCAAVWYGVMTVTGYELGLIALVIGLVVGVAVRLGSKERGGWLYQGLAVTLTYLAIVTAYVPIVAEALAQGMAEETTAAAEPASLNAEPPGAILYAVAVPLALASPIILLLDDFMGSVLWLLIIGIALYEAWKVNQGNGAPRIEGPFDPS